MKVVLFWHTHVFYCRSNEKNQIRITSFNTLAERERASILLLERLRNRVGKFILKYFISPANATCPW